MQQCKYYYDSHTNEVLNPFYVGAFPVSFSDWELIDQEERRRGQRLRKPREKIVSVEEMITVIQKYIS